MQLVEILLVVLSLYGLITSADNNLRRSQNATRRLDEDESAESPPPQQPISKTKPPAVHKSTTPIKKKGLNDGVANKNPTVFILGVQKGGSSSMMWMLIMHPQLCSGERKETHFFTGIYENLMDHGASHKEIKEDYWKLFRESKCTDNENAMFVDGTPVLHRSALASRNLNEYYGKEGEKDNLKFIVMLREPVSRDNSWFEHSARQYLTGHQTGKGFSDDRKGSIKALKTFKEMWGPEIEAVRTGKKKRDDVSNEIAGDYLTQLKDFTKFFKRKQLLVLNSKMAFTRTHETMEVIRKFLGVVKETQWETEPFPHDDHLGSTNNSDDPDCVFRHIPKMDCDMRDTMGKYYEGTNQDLMDWLEETRSEAPPMEPPFEAFGKSYKNMSCVPDARGMLNEIIKNDKRDIC